MSLMRSLCILGQNIEKRSVVSDFYGELDFYIDLHIFHYTDCKIQSIKGK